MRLEDDQEIAGAIKVLGHDLWLTVARTMNANDDALRVAKADMDIALKLHARMLAGDTPARLKERSEHLVKMGKGGY